MVLLNNFCFRVCMVVELDLLIRVLGIVSIALSLTLVYLFIKIYKSNRSVILLGLPLGFLFLAISYVLLGVHLMITDSMITGISSSIMWLRVVTVTLGFALIAVSYFLSGKSKGGITKHNFFTISLWSSISIICVLGVLLFINPSGLASIYSFNQLFTIANLALLSYILFFIVRNLEMSEGVSNLISAPLAFAFIWLGQFSFLIWKLDGGNASLVGSQIAPIIGLVLFIRMYYIIGKGRYLPFDGQ